MPYADPIKKKEYYERHKKQYDAAWKNKNRERWNKYQRERADHPARWVKIKNDPEMLETFNKNIKIYRNKNREELNRRTRVRIKNLEDTYILKLLHQEDGIPRRLAREHPDLIEAHRLILRTKRELKKAI